jgi:hypothetical protein
MSPPGFNWSCALDTGALGAVAAADSVCCAHALDDRIARLIAGAAMRMIRLQRFGLISLT